MKKNLLPMNGNILLLLVIDLCQPGSSLKNLLAELRERQITPKPFSKVLNRNLTILTHLVEQTYSQMHEKHSCKLKQKVVTDNDKLNSFWIIHSFLFKDTSPFSKPRYS